MERIFQLLGLERRGREGEAVVTLAPGILERLWFCVQTVLVVTVVMEAT